jgi:hypothetical protein
MPHVRREHTIDYLGAAVIVASVSSLLLYTAWAGPERGWGDSLSLGLLVGGLLLAALFVVVELRAAEPIIPMRLFRNSIYTVSNAFGFLIGAAMFGVMVFIPVYLQLAKGMSPTESGLGMLPMLVGLFTTSILGGRRMSRTGSYKWYPPAGASVVLVAVILMTQLEADSPYWFAGLAMLVMGLGLGLTMQVLTVAVQNSVDRSEMGVATSSVQFFRQMGGSFGTALFGAVLSVRLTSELSQVDGGGASAIPDSVKADLTSNMAVVERLPAQAQALVTDAFSDALSGTFLVAVPLVVLALLVGLLLKEIPLMDRDPAPSAEPPSASRPKAGQEPVGDVRVLAGEEPGRHEEVVAVDDHGR